jgi:hypothetical protein
LNFSRRGAANRARDGASKAINYHCRCRLFGRHRQLEAKEINLAWAENSNKEDGFLIERCAGGGNCTNFFQVGQTGPGVTAFASAGLSPGTTYTYRVRAFSTGGHSPYSNLAKEKTPK